MKISSLICTKHARRQQARRNLSDADIGFVLTYGQQYFSAGVMHVFLGHRDLPRNRELYQRFARLEGTVLVIYVGHITPVLVTVYRNHNALKNIRKKARYDCRKKEK
jgi:Domain of unknown function (DUF4258)